MIPVSWLAAGGLGIAVLSFGAGWQANNWRHDSAALKTAHKTEAARVKAQGEADETAIAYEKGKADAEQRFNDRAGQVRTIYRDRPVPAVCEPGPDALRVLDEALADANQPASKLAS